MLTRVPVKKYLYAEKKEFLVAAPPGLFTVTESPFGIKTVYPLTSNTSLSENLGEIITGFPSSITEAFFINTCILSEFSDGTKDLESNNS